MAQLRLQLKQERVHWSANWQLSYLAWVEPQALKGDTGEISQLRGWACRASARLILVILSLNVPF